MLVSSSSRRQRKEADCFLLILQPLGHLYMSIVSLILLGCISKFLLISFHQVFWAGAGTTMA